MLNTRPISASAAMECSILARENATLVIVNHIWIYKHLNVSNAQHISTLIKLPENANNAKMECF